ncbi:MAG: ABC transporter ATP-binding protein/permease [Bacilli bacterium]|nr:ABC transporter ATP-binding protein/permease [Bacilli bacterium]
MLEIKNITKVYNTGGFKQKALDGVTVNFRESEFAAILGPSGSGKTTFLNIIGGLDHYTNGDLIINEISTKKYKDSDWDSYRNHRIGFVFQNYNLITHQSILSNVILALTLSGISKKEAISRSKKALKEVGLEKHMNKLPNQLSGGQMQRVAIARALVNDPDILLADEPTGALDSETSVQIMEILKKISKNKLVIMVTHNPDLAKEYATRIINLKDGKIVSDTNKYNGKVNTKETKEESKVKTKKTKMSRLTALTLSFNNLMTKKGRTVLVSFAGSIGIIGIALILALSTGFQNYIDKIQEDTLTSYPLTIMEESTDITGMLLSMSEGDGEDNKDGTVKEEQYISSMLGNISSNDLKSFKKYLEDNYNIIKKDLANVKYSYSIDPTIYTIDSKKNLAKVNPSNLFSSMMGSNSMMSSFSSYSSVYSQMIDNRELIEESYKIVSGRYPEAYNEMILVLPDPNSIPDLLVYSLGLRDNKELTQMISSIMSGETVKVDNEPLKFTYEDLLNIELKLIMPADTYKYNKKYKVYEDMTTDEKYMKNLYDKATSLKIVGIVTQKEGTTSNVLNPGVAYTKELIDYIIDYSKDTEIVKKQIENQKVDVFSGEKFSSDKKDFDFSFEDLVNIDTKKLQSAFNINMNQNTIKKQTEGYMNQISNSLTMDIKPAKTLFNDNLNTLITGVFASIENTVSLNEIETVVDSYLNKDEVKTLLSKMEKDYVLPKDTYKEAYSGILKGLLQIYINAYYGIDQSLTEEPTNPVAIINEEILNTVKSSYLENPAIIGTTETMATYMTEAKMKKQVLTKVGELTSNLTSSIASSFKVDEAKIASAFSINLTDEEINRIMTAMTQKNETNAKTNLILLGYQDKEEPTYMSFYFNSFDSKENFLSFIDKYNNKMELDGKEDSVINYTDTTGILMKSVKTIVNAVSYVLIAFVSVSLVVSSIMIGIITYISVYERTKEIGILRAIGASKRNISSIFNAETFIIGLLSGLFGIGITYSLIPIINMIIKNLVGNINLKAVLPTQSAIILVILSIILTLIGGFIPAKSASKKDPVESLRCE